MSVSSSDAKGRGRGQDLYRWRGRKTLRSRLNGGIYQHRVKLIWAALLAFAFMLFAWLIWLLLFAPQRTPLVILTVEPYSWPLPPNAMAAEDVEKFRVLDGENVTMRTGEGPILTRQGFLDRLEREIRVGASGDEKLPLVIWISMHGVADATTNKAYLIPTQSSPTDSDTWIELEEVISRLAKVPPDRQALLILDCHRMQVNWNIGLLANSFSDCASELIRGSAPANLAVLLAAGPEEQAAVSPDLRGSVFAHYLRQGLAGAADSEHEFGNQDGWVAIGELHGYVRERVNQWGVHHRGARQNPILLTKDAGLDFRVCKSLNQQAITQLIQSDRGVKRSAPTISPERLDRLWRQLDEFRALGLYQSEPVGWRNLEHQMLWLEQLAESGSGYHSVSLRVIENVEGQFQAIGGRLAQARQSRSVGDDSTVISGNRFPLPHAMRAHSLPTVEYFGTPQTESVTVVRGLFEEFDAQPQPQLLSDTMSILSKGQPAELEETQFLRMLDRYQFPGIWENPQAVAQLLNLRSEVGNLVVPRDDQGLPADARVHGWIRQLVSRLDATRRFAEDSLFTQGQAGLFENLDDTRAAVQDATAAARALQEILGVCDQAMAQTPYFAQWLTHPLHRDDPATTADAINDRLLPLIANTSDLSEKLANHRQVSTESIIAVEDFAVTNVKPLVGSLLEEWNRSQSRLLVESESNNPATVGELEAALSVPLADWEARRDLRRAHSRLETRLHEVYDHRDAGSDEPDNSGDNSTADSYTSRIATWDEHPLFAILGEQAAAKTLGQNPITRFLSGVNSQLELQSAEASLAGQRDVCSKAARRFRTAAPIWFSTPQRDPVVELRRIDLQSLLLWHAERSLDDFWGPAGQRRAFFDLAASDYLQAAMELAPLQSAGARAAKDLQEMKYLSARLEASRRAAPRWMTTKLGPTIQIDAGDPVETMVSVTAEHEEEGFVPPSGTATLLIQDGQSRRVDDATFLPTPSVAFPAAGAEVTVTLPAGAARVGDDLKAQAMFRGHEYSAALNIEQLGGIVVDIRPHSYRQSEVTLSSPWSKLSVAFVLDCSGSMEDPLAASSGEEPAASRLDVAKLALQEILFNLGLRRNVRAGVNFFGHRLGWSTDAPVRRLPQPDFPGVIDPQLTPSQDVEPVLPLSPLDVDAVKELIPRINGVKPWGQSPLYLSVVQALGEFGADDAGADRHVIVITDGANYQYIPPTETDVVATTDDDVRNAWAQSQIPVHILGLGMDRSEDRQAIEEFDRLCVDTGGRFQSLTGSTDLVAALSQLLDPGTYRLGRQEIDSGTDRRANLGAPIRIAPAPQTAEQFWLTYEAQELVDPEANATPSYDKAQEQLLLEGGESLQLYVDPQGAAIHAFPFDDNIAASAELVTQTGEPTDHVVRIHRPTRDSLGHVTFPVSWQQRDTRAGAAQGEWRVTDRPAEVWIEVQPVAPREPSNDPSYVFFDANYEPKQPVPLIHLVARDWPKSATKANVRVWCQPPAMAGFELLPPAPSDGSPEPTSGLVRAIVINDALQSPMTVAEGVTLRVDRPAISGDDPLQRLRFIMEFEDAGPPVSSLKLSLPSYASARPARIVRTFDSRHRMAVHEFFFDPQQTELPQDIDLSSRQQELDGAWQLTVEALDVDVAEPGMFLPVSSRN